MNQWNYISLGNVCDIVAGGTPSRSNPKYFGGDIPWVKISDMLQGIITHTDETITKASIEDSAAKILPAGTVLLSIFATIGRTAILGIDAATNQAIVGVIPKAEAKLNTSYLRYCLDDSIRELTKQARGVAQININSTILKSLKIPFPPLTEQERIVRLLDQADSLRKLRSQASAHMDAFIPALFDEMFGDPATNPKEWPIVPVNSFVKEFQAGSSILTDSSMSKDTNYWVLKVSAVTWGEYKPLESKPVPKDYIPLPEHLVKAGDLLFSRANTTELVGATVFVYDTPPNRLLSDKLWRFVWRKPNEIEPLFVWTLFQNKEIRNELGRRATGTGGSMKNISQPKVLSMRVPIPPLALQREFARRVKAARELQAAQARSEERIEALYQSMLSRAFAGEL